MSAARRAGMTHTPSADAADRGLDLDGEVEVAAGQLQRVARDLEAHPGQDGQGPAPGGHGPGRGGQGLDEDVSFASELHVDFSGLPHLQLALS